ncbi:MAG: hypothetical protein HQM09_17950 [Candidatus Riflebacteria bacterium]|nr:hypothetical protein [Candidatus Riflebacteria bacterium]
MDASIAYHLLELPDKADPATIEAAFKKKRNELDNLIAQAATEELKEKYRSAVAELAEARRMALADIRDRKISLFLGIAAVLLFFLAIHENSIPVAATIPQGSSSHEIRKQSEAGKRAPEENAAKVQGNIFQAGKKEWSVGRNNISWDETQAWSNGLGDGWHTPTKAELKQLFDEVGKKSAIGKDFGWAEARDASSAWTFCFKNGVEKWQARNYSNRNLRALAVRSR